MLVFFYRRPPDVFRDAARQDSRLEFSMSIVAATLRRAVARIEF
jgi:hypothetical protein